MPRLKGRAKAERRRQRRQTDIDRALALHNMHVDTLRLGWLAAHFERQKRRCAYCGITMTMCPPNRFDSRRATLDHLVARSKGGADTLRNTVAACLACNTSKGDMDPDRFKQMRRGSI
jgi:5-methylcytosine-specific restriction endonuclease McrA